MKTITVYFLLLLSISGFAQDAIATKEITTTLRMLNQVRKAAGLSPVTISDNLSDGCQKHARYLVINNGNPLVQGMNAHTESNTLEGYTESGENAAKKSVIHFVKPTTALDGWIKTFYHRVPLLQPNLKEIGIGYYEEDGKPVTLVDCISGLSGTSTIDAVFYPAENQSNIPRAMGPELPHPVGKAGNYGFPITVFFTHWQEVKNVVFTLTDSTGKNIECYISTPEKPATDFPQWNTICAIPEDVLAANARYQVTVICSQDGKRFSKMYTFQTGKDE